MFDSLMKNLGGIADYVSKNDTNTNVALAAGAGIVAIAAPGALLVGAGASLLTKSFLDATEPEVKEECKNSKPA